MLGTQAKRFSSSLMEDGNCAYEIVGHLALLRNTHGNKGVRETADRALSRVLHQVLMLLSRAPGM